jgi:hypothetical protein
MGASRMTANASVFGAGQRRTRGKTVHRKETWRHELLATLVRHPVVVSAGSVEQHGPHCEITAGLRRLGHGVEVAGEGFAPTRSRRRSAS